MGKATGRLPLHRKGRRGYCSDCGSRTGLDGLCTVCIPRRLGRIATCPVCGMPMAHYRLRGYKCFNESHNEMVASGWEPPGPEQSR